MFSGDAARPVDAARLRRILAVRLDNIGDVVMLAPALRALHVASPAATVTLLASTGGARAAPLLPWVDEIEVVEALWQDASGALRFDPTRERRLIDRLAAGAHDAAFIFTSFSQTPFAAAYACYLAGIPVRVGQAREFGGSVLSHQVEPLSDGSHQAERNLHLLDATGIPVADRRPAIEVPDEATAHAHELLTTVGVNRGQPYAVVAPGASCSSRRYDGARFARVAREFGLASGWPIVAIGATRDDDLVPAAAGGPVIRSLVGRTSLAEAAAVIAGARLLIAVNSAPMHLADALRVPSVVLFAGTDEEAQFGPRAAASILLRRPTDCAPCRLFECPYAMECLDIEPAAVVEAALRLLSAEPATEERWTAFAS